ncbi:MAG TPA: prolipoprotein diacylglyceryl transferase [Patescibacteria group bacterium]|nr:prolipoprotein diacylglyceryl transferase [Patescibacteria group bacterium]
MKYFYWVSGICLAAVLIFFFFIPAFAGNISIPQQITFGRFAIRLYGITMAASVLVGYLVARHYAWRFGISQESVDDVAFWITIVAFLGARVYYVAVDFGLYRNNLSEIYKIWHGGLSIYGAIISGLIFAYFYARTKAFAAFRLLDLLAVALPLAQGLGRFGNFFNQEAFGLPTDLPWKMYVDAAHRPAAYIQASFFHPTFLYEALCSVIIFFILVRIMRMKVLPGVLVFTYLGLYSLSRFFIEGIRLDSSYIHGIKVDQVTAVAGVLAAGVALLMIWRSARARA